MNRVEYSVFFFLPSCLEAIKLPTETVESSQLFSESSSTYEDSGFVADVTFLTAMGDLPST